MFCYNQEISNIPGEERVRLLEISNKSPLIERREKWVLDPKITGFLATARGDIACHGVIQRLD
jgi:hypothetical protein